MTTTRGRLPPLSDAEEEAIQRQIASDPDNPELTDEQIVAGRPFAEALPELAESIRRAKARARSRRRG